ncbi:hypothetical protein BH23BAC3_BH23BAC3_27230 [soil metagenome]
MTRSVFITIVTLSLLLISGCGPDENTMPQSPSEIEPVSWPAIMKEGHGVLHALYVPADGFAYAGETGVPTGFTVALLVDFTRFLAEEYSIMLELNFIEVENWTDYYKHIVEGEDGMIGMGNVTITEQRRRELAFSPPYMTNIASLISHADAPEMTSFDEMNRVFEGRDALAFEGTLHEERLQLLVEQYHPEAEIHLANSNDEIIDRVSESDSYFAYIDIYNYWRAVDRGAALRRHEAGDEAAEQFGYIMPLNTSWEPIINEYFLQDGGLLLTDHYRSLMAEHLGERLADLLIEAHREQVTD